MCALNGRRNESVWHIKCISCSTIFACQNKVLSKSRAAKIFYMINDLCINVQGVSVMFSVITNIYNKKTKGPTLTEWFTATGKMKKVFFDN